MKLLSEIEISEIHEIKEIPTFSASQIPEALQACVLNGVAKVTGHISEASRLALLNNIRFADEPSVLDDFPVTNHLQYCDELKELHDLVVADNPVETGQGIRFTPITTPVAGPEDKFTGHHDTLSPFGISAVSALNGPNALFVASPYAYYITKDIFTSGPDVPPDFIDEYGAGDTMLIRQRIDEFNGQSVNLRAMIHEGIASEKRKLLATDFRFVNFNLAPQAA